MDVEQLRTLLAVAETTDSTIPSLNPVKWINVTKFPYCADPSGMKDSTTAIQNALSAVIDAGAGTVYIPPGNYKILTTIIGNVNGSAVSILADPGATLMYYGSGDCLRIYDGSSYDDPPRTFGIQSGLFGFLVIDGSNSSGSAPSTGLHIGDIFQLSVTCSVRNFSKSDGSIGVHFDNSAYWTEQMYARVYVENCVSHVVFDVSGANTSTASFGRADIGIYINQVNPEYDGLVLKNGAVIYDGAIALRGNFVGSSSPLASCALRITGTVPAGHPGAGNYANIADSRLDFGLECVSNSNTPKSMIFGNNSNRIINCYGVIDFGGDDDGGNFTSTNRIGNVTPFNGNIKGDSVLTFGAQGFPSGAVWGASSGFALGDFTSASPLSNNGTINPDRAIKRVTTSGNVTGIIIGSGSYDGQTIWVINESSNTITMAASGTSHVADGTSDVIPALCARMYIFDGTDNNLWYRCA